MTDSGAMSNAYQVDRSHRWPFAGVLAKPIVPISKLQFVGRGKVYPDDSRQAQHVAPPLTYLEGKPEPLGYKDYQVVKAWRWKHAFDKAKRFPNHPTTACGLVLLTADGEPIGRVLFNHVHLDDTPHRSMQLGAELIAAFEVAYPHILIAYAFTMPKRSYTKAGKDTIELAYELLLQRGAVSTPTTSKKTSPTEA